MPFNGIATSLVDIKCHEGFKCVSAVDVFGRNHNYEYKGLLNGSPVPIRFRGSFEEGCPARGEMTPAGDCRDFGKGPLGFCWSKDRYESGPTSPCKDPSMCMCVKAADNGTSTHTSATKAAITHKVSESVQGAELQTRTYWTQPEAQCEECASHNCSRESCNKCHNCEYGTKTSMGRTAKGCYDRDYGVARRDRVAATDGRKYLFKDMDGLDSTQEEQKLVVIPHFPLWDPGDARMDTEVVGQEGDPSNNLQFPYQSRREPLSREAWIDAYKQAAPRIQRVLDMQADNVKEWGPKANDIDCTQDIQGRVEKIRLFRRECRKHQGLVDKLAPDTPFESNVPDGSGGFIPVKCEKGGQGMCQSLNCYSDDADLIKGITQMHERAKTCRVAMGILVAEEEQNGPVSPEAEITARTGGRLEVALPPPGVKFKEGAGQAAMPVDVGLALWAAAGAMSTARRNFVAAAFPTAEVAGKGRPLPSRGGTAGHGTASQSRRVDRTSDVLHDFLCPRDVGALLATF